MKIGILKESLAIGGTERSAANISKTLAEKHDVFVVLFNGKEIKYEYGGELIDVCLPPKPGVVGKVLNTFLRSKKVDSVIKNNQLDILFTFTGIGNYQTKKKCKKVVKIISARDYGGMNAKYPLYHKALLNSDAMICNSEYTKNFYLSKYPEHGNKVFSVYNVIDVEHIQMQGNEETESSYCEFVSAHTKNIVSVGRFCKEKGFEYLLEAFAKARTSFDGLGLVLVGDGELRDKYQEIVEKHNLQGHVYFAGFQVNPYKYMARCNCFVLSSLSEGFPNVLAEAMALGLPVIAVNCYSGPAEILRNDCDYSAVNDVFLDCDYGVISPGLAESNNDNALEQLALSIEYMLSDDVRMRNYSAVAKKRAAEFSKDAAAQKLDNIFQELLSRRAKK